jgi:predicted ATPase
LGGGFVHNFVTLALDPVALATHCQVTTRWHVLTGPACSGKTTLLGMLAARGFHTAPESARPYYDGELAKGRSIEQIRADGLSLQRGIAALQGQFEDQLVPEEVSFLDRAMPDSLTFYRVYGLNPNEVLPKCFRYRYATVFLLERLEVSREAPLGPEDVASARLLSEWLARDYGALGYQVVRVPRMSIEERLAFILETIGAR